MENTILEIKCLDKGKGNGKYNFGSAGPATDGDTTTLSLDWERSKDRRAVRPALTQTLLEKDSTLQVFRHYTLSNTGFTHAHGVQEQFLFS